MNDLEALKAARYLIADPKRWTTETFARDSEDRPVSPTDEDAVCFCALGALSKVTGIDACASDIRMEDIPGVETLNRAVRGTGACSSIGVYNDNYRHAGVLCVFDDAIKACQ